jgi:hypothetical protein
MLSCSTAHSRSMSTRLLMPPEAMTGIVSACAMQEARVLHRGRSDDDEAQAVVE